MSGRPQPRRVTKASLRAGGGKLQVVTTDSVPAQMAVTIPEALISRTPELQSGDISPEAAEQVLALAEGASAILLGPGITSPESATRLLREIVPHLRDQHVVMDAGARDWTSPARVTCRRAS